MWDGLGMPAMLDVKRVGERGGRYDGELHGRLTGRALPHMEKAKTYRAELRCAQSLCGLHYIPYGAIVLRGRLVLSVSVQGARLARELDQCVLDGGIFATVFGCVRHETGICVFVLAMERSRPPCFDCGTHIEEYVDENAA